MRGTEPSGRPGGGSSIGIGGGGVLFFFFSPFLGFCAEEEAFEEVFAAAAAAAFAFAAAAAPFLLSAAAAPSSSTSAFSLLLPRLARRVARPPPAMETSSAASVASQRVTSISSASSSSSPPLSSSSPSSSLSAAAAAAASTSAAFASAAFTASSTLGSASRIGSANSILGPEGGGRGGISATALTDCRAADARLRSLARRCSEESIGGPAVPPRRLCASVASSLLGSRHAGLLSGRERADAAMSASTASRSGPAGSCLRVTASTCSAASETARARFRPSLLATSSSSSEALRRFADRARSLSRPSSPPSRLLRVCGRLARSRGLKTWNGFVSAAGVGAARRRSSGLPRRERLRRQWS